MSRKLKYEHCCGMAYSYHKKPEILTPQALEDGKRTWQDHESDSGNPNRKNP